MAAAQPNAEMKQIARYDAGTLESLSRSGPSEITRYSFMVAMLLRVIAFRFGNQLLCRKHFTSLDQRTIFFYVYSDSDF